MLSSPVQIHFHLSCLPLCCAHLSPTHDVEIQWTCCAGPCRRRPRAPRGTSATDERVVSSSPEQNVDNKGNEGNKKEMAGVVEAQRRGPEQLPPEPEAERAAARLVRRCRQRRRHEQQCQTPQPRAQQHDEQHVELGARDLLCRSMPTSSMASSSQNARSAAVTSQLHMGISVNIGTF